MKANNTNKTMYVAIHMSGPGPVYRALDDELHAPPLAEHQNEQHGGVAQRETDDEAGEEGHAAAHTSVNEPLPSGGKNPIFSPLRCSSVLPNDERHKKRLWGDKVMRARISGGSGGIKVGGGNQPRSGSLDCLDRRKARRLPARGKAAHARQRQPDLARELGARHLPVFKPFIQLHVPFLHQVQEWRKCILTLGGVDRKIVGSYGFRMPRKSDIANAPNAISLWREIRGMNQEDLAAKSGISAGQISRIEAGRAGYTQESLESLAAALRVESWMLLLVPRGSLDTLELAEAVASTTPGEHRRFLNLLRAARA